MTKDEAQRLVREAKHSMALAISAMGTSFPTIANLFVKWPDALDSYVAEDWERFYLDLCPLIISPIRAMTEAYIEKNNDKEARREVYEALRVYKPETILQPVLVKNALIRICNRQIQVYNQANKTSAPLIKELDHGKSNN